MGPKNQEFWSWRLKSALVISYNPFCSPRRLSSFRSFQPDKEVDSAMVSTLNRLGRLRKRLTTPLCQMGPGSRKSALSQLFSKLTRRTPWRDLVQRLSEVYCGAETATNLGEFVGAISPQHITQVLTFSEWYPRGLFPIVTSRISFKNQCSFSVIVCL